MANKASYTSLGGGKILQKAVYSLNQHPIYGATSPVAGVQESWGESGSGTSLYYP